MNPFTNVLVFFVSFLRGSGSNQENCCIHVIRCHMHWFDFPHFYIMPWAYFTLGRPWNKSLTCCSIIEASPERRVAKQRYQDSGLFKLQSWQKGPMKSFYQFVIIETHNLVGRRRFNDPSWFVSAWHSLNCAAVGKLFLPSWNIVGNMPVTFFAVQSIFCFLFLTTQ